MEGVGKSGVERGLFPPFAILEASPTPLTHNRSQHLELAWPLRATKRLVALAACPVNQLAQTPRCAHPLCLRLLSWSLSSGLGPAAVDAQFMRPSAKPPPPPAMLPGGSALGWWQVASTSRPACRGRLSHRTPLCEETLMRCLHALALATVGAFV